MKEFGLRPDKRLGQNFLIDRAALWRIVDAAGISEEDEILEIGPGLGNLTRLLAARAKRVVAVEIDQDLIPPLKKVLNSFGNVDVIAGDILELDPAKIAPASRYLVVANIPYYITSAIIRHLMESRTKPSRIVLTVQREVAQRICAQPGEMSLLSLSIQVYGEPAIVARIPAGSFHPAPKVDSAVVRIDLLPEPRVPEDVIPQFFELAKAAFTQKRKKLRNSLAAMPGFDSGSAEALLNGAGIDPARRPETLSLDEWKKLVNGFATDH
jgi:16S rRNA (adenine1518-N6/adenine1519-N6)-dimethyltransferase